MLLTLALALPAAAQDATDVPLPTEPAPDAAQTPAAPVAAQPAASAAEAPGAVLRGLDKMAGATTDLTVRNGETADYGTLKVTVSDCRYPQGDPAADAWAHLTIADRSGKALFDGWMIASSPALSALDHPRYDIWVIRCISN
ncbi:MAG: DUF2155 domain-containing protein [Proteobacteria bacterium]|nr:DUF2155 domain-containing protein [Pseudomonadota bacterium]MBS0573698.1 DUF2155 domain-containing protein [Pseudomonadota bacterium]